jgi:glucuronosyltransferase
MRSAALDLAWYQYLLLDVIAVLFLAVFAVLAALYFIVKKLATLCLRNKNEHKTKTKPKAKTS